MAMLPGAFNSEEHEEMGTFEVLPADWYVSMIQESTIKPTKKALEEKNGNDELPADQYSGLRLNLKFKIMGGEFDGRTLFEGLNIKNPNAQAVEISQKTLTSICKAVGKVSINDSEELHGIPMKIKLGIKPASAQYDAQNTFKAFEKYDGAVPSGTSGSKSKKDVSNAKEGSKSGGKRAWEE